MIHTPTNTLTRKTPPVYGVIAVSGDITLRMATSLALQLRLVERDTVHEWHVRSIESSTNKYSWNTAIAPPCPLSTTSRWAYNVPLFHCNWHRSASQSLGQKNRQASGRPSKRVSEQRSKVCKTQPTAKASMAIWRRPSYRRI
jgi:hypothetical protein